MTITTFSSRDLSRNTGRAKRAAERGPVIITERGRRAYVLLSIEEYQRLSGKRKTLGDMLAMENPEAIDEQFEFPKIGIELPRQA